MHMLGRFRTADLEGWKTAIASDTEAHLSAGLHFRKVWSNADDPSEIYFLFRVDDLAKARAFLKEAGALDEEKQRRGEIPVLSFLDER